MTSKIFSSLKKKLGKGKAPDYSSTPEFHNATYGETFSTVEPDRGFSTNGMNDIPCLGFGSSSSHDRVDEPPPYSFQEIGHAKAAPEYSREPSAEALKEDRYTLLAHYDTVILVDDSGSMSGRRWDETREALSTVAEICTKYDPDGIDIYFLNRTDEPRFQNVTTAATVMDIFTNKRDIDGRPTRFTPWGPTPTGRKLRGILEDYLHKFEQDRSIKGLNVICITDGAASHGFEPDLPLIECAIKLSELQAPRPQLGVQFLQVGNDKEATKELQYLDNDLSDMAQKYGYPTHLFRDIVDTMPFQGDEGAKLTGEGILKVVMGAVCKRLDWKDSKDTHS